MKIKILITMLLVAFLLPGVVYPIKPTEIYKQKVEEAVNCLIDCWAKEDERCVKKYQDQLVRYESYILVVEPKWEGFYLQRIPPELNPEALPPFLYLLREKDRRGINLLNIKELFEGKSFLFELREGGGSNDRDF